MARIDFEQTPRDKPLVMNRWFSLLILAAALLGLLGQEAAFARTIATKPASAAVAAAQMTPECAAMMELAQQPQQPTMPCEGMTPDCAAKMGCTVALALFEPLDFNPSPQIRADLPTLLPVAPLIGRDTGPEPEPPALLG